MARGGEPSGEDLFVSVSPDPGAWLLVVLRAEGTVAVSRRLEVGEKRCEELADLAALIVDRFLAQIEWSGRPPEIPSAPTVEEAPPEPPARGGLVLSAGAAFAIGLPAWWTPGASLEAASRRGSWQISLSLLAFLPSRLPVLAEGRELGLFASQSFLGLASLERCGPWGGLEACGGALAGAGLTMAQALGPYLYQQNPRTLWLPLLGAQGRLARPLPAGLELSLELALAAPLGSARLEVEGTDVGYSPPGAGAVASLRLGRKFF